MCLVTYVQKVEQLVIALLTRSFSNIWLDTVDLMLELERAQTTWCL